MKIEADALAAIKRLDRSTWREAQAEAQAAYISRGLIAARKMRARALTTTFLTPLI